MKTKTVYKVVSPATIGTYGHFQRGELVDTTRVPGDTLKQLEAQGVVTIEEVQQWNPKANSGAGGWEPWAITGPVAEEDPAEAKPKGRAAKADEALKAAEPTKADE